MMIMGNPPAFQLYAKDFDMDTATWENDEIGAYLRLLLYEWVNGGLPDDTYKLSKIARESERKFKKKWKNLSQKFTLDGNGLLINKKMEEIRYKQMQYIESQREKGKIGAEKRWEGHIAPAIATAMPVPQPKNSSSSSSSSSLNINNKNICNISLKGFEEWWKEYPKRNGIKVGKAKCKKLFFFLKEEDLLLLMKATINYANCKQVRDGYAKDPVRFLKDDFWRDWIYIESNQDIQPKDRKPSGLEWIGEALAKGWTIDGQGKT